MATPPPTRSSTRRKSKKALESSPEENINVKRRAPPKSQEPVLSSPHQGSESSEAAKHSIPNRPRGGGGKVPMMSASPQATAAAEDEDDENESIEEYDFTGEPTDDEMGDDSNEDTNEDELDEDSNSAIILSSDPPNQPEDKETEPFVPRRPWKEKTFTPEHRKAWELMYSQVTPYAIEGSWALTEDYQRTKDDEMLMYIQDHPLPSWVIPQQQVTNAYNQLLERMRWRQYGIPIYGRDRVPAHPNAPTAPPPLLPMHPRAPPPGPGPSQHLPLQQLPYPPQQYPGFPQPMPQNMQQAPFQHGMPMHMAPPQQMGPQQQMGPAPHPNLGQLPPNLVPLPSQPYHQQMPMHHGQPHPGMGYPVGPVQHIPYGAQLSMYIGPPMTSAGMYPQGPQQNRHPRKPREKKETPAVGSPAPRAPTPPYAHRPKPVDPQKAAKKPSRKQPANRRQTQRRPAEADDFPWTRPMDYHLEKARASWDESIYSRETLEGMSAARDHNARLINGVDAKLGEAQRQARFKKKGLVPEAEPPKPEPEVEAKPREKKKRNSNINDNSDPNATGSYSWANPTSADAGRQMGYESPMDAIYAGEDGHLSSEQMADLIIVWNPSKKGGPDNLRPAQFTVKDSVLTRQQLKKTPILTRRAAECLIDFCPELLWRGTLLRVTSEGGHGNKDVRDRFCHNGSYCDKATITKRISAALGQKQVQPKSKGYQNGEYEWYEQNVKDFTHYIEFFGHRTGHRNMLKIQMQGDKRKAKMQGKTGEDGAGSPGEDGTDGPNKRRKLDADGAHTPAPDSEDNVAGGEETETAEESNNEEDDAVSAQDSDILDEMSDSN